METENKLRDNAKVIRAAIELPVPPEDIDGLMGKLNQLINLKGLAANNTASAKAHWRQHQLLAMEGFIEDPLHKLMSASERTSYIQAKCGNSESLFMLCEAQNKGISYAIEGLRTMISCLKTELEQSKYSQT